jgi:hypothetical protein
MNYTRDEAKEDGRTEQQHELDESHCKVQEAKRAYGTRSTLKMVSKKLIPQSNKSALASV